MSTHLPVIDVSRAPAVVAREIDTACRDLGFFYAVGHDISAKLAADLFAAALRFLRLPVDAKREIAMARGGRAWRGWFPLGGELTSGVPDRKEGLYFGAELGPAHPRGAAGVPLRGPNLFPAHPAALRKAVLAYLDALTDLGHLLARGLALALGLDGDWFATHLTADPTILFRIFRYPPTGTTGH